MLQNIYDLYDKLERNNIMLSFKGDFTPELLSSILNIIETKMEYIESTPRIRKRVFNVMVECLQNLYHHNETVKESTSDTLKPEEKTGIVMIAKNVSGYSIFTGNLMMNDGVEALKGKLEEINGMDKQELKALYKSVLNNGQMSAKGGGGLGMIDIARRSGQKLDYGFVPFDDKHSFFSLNVNIEQ